MGTKSRETIYGASIRAAAERATEARKEADRLAVEAWNKRMLGFQGPAQPVSVVNRYVGKLAPMPGVSPDHPAPARRSCAVPSPILFRQAFHVIGDDDLSWISLANALQVLQTTPQLGSRLP
jgi:hypothetical protein